MHKLFSDKSLEHFGIPGMKWGVQKAPITRTKLGAQLAKKPSSEEGGSDHAERVKLLKSQIKRAKFKRFDSDLKSFAAKEKAMNKELDNLQTKKLKDLEVANRNNKSKISKWLGRAVVKADISSRRRNIVGKLEDEQIRAEDKRNKAKKKAQDKAYENYSKRVDAQWNSIKGLKFPADIKAALKADRVESAALVEALLEIELEHQ